MPRITDLHKIVDQSLLGIKSLTKYKLHRILIELQGLIYEYIPCKRWQAIEGYENGEVDDINDFRPGPEYCFIMPISLYDSRKDAINWYPYYEIEFAERLGYYKDQHLLENIDYDYYLENEFYLEDGEEYAIEINPQWIVVDRLSELLNTFSIIIFHC